MGKMAVSGVYSIVGQGPLTSLQQEPFRLVDETNGTMETGLDSPGRVYVFVEIHVQESCTVKEHRYF